MVSVLIDIEYLSSEQCPSIKLRRKKRINCPGAYHQMVVLSCSVTIPISFVLCSNNKSL
jgi:hypothetical protein